MHDAPTAMLPPGATPVRGRVATVRDLLVAVAVVWAIEIILAVALATACHPRPVWEFPLGILACTVLATGATFAVVWYHASRKYARPFPEAFAIFDVPPRTLLWSLAIGVGGAVAATALMIALPQGDSPLARMTARPDGFVAMMALAILLPPFEEIYYRGFLFPILKRRYGAAAAVAIVIAWFGMAHLRQLAGSWVAFPIVMAMGAVWTVQRHRTGSLLPSTACHWAYNITLIAISIATAGAH